MLDIQNISKTFNPGTVNEKTALNGLSLHLNEGDFVTVIGGNGAGKSTMLNAVAGVWPVDEGKILIDGADVTRLSEYQRAKYIGRVFQDPMTGTAATMQIEGKPGSGGPPRQAPHPAHRHHPQRAGGIQRAAQDPGPGAGKPPHRPGGPAVGRPAPGADFADGHHEPPKLLLLDEHTAALDPKTALKVLTLSASWWQKTT